MITDLMKKGLLGKRMLLMSTYKKAGLSENEVMIILMIMHLSEDKTLFVTPNTLAENMHLSASDIDKAIAKMSNNNLIKFVSKKIDLTPLFTRLIGILQEEYMMKENEDLFSVINNKLDNKLLADQMDEITIMINGTISKQQLFRIVNNNEFKNYEELIKIIAKEISNKNKMLTRFNWLEN
ncbi:hypothetical protein ESOMN_v1c04550 [Williamsoniiplasma somnilux]|uniref:DnaD N-terminal domain-containing protein n=1 Tax=Williamsoniiplasma somnilux TaxID=215578 RepID=A0A2K8NYH0_9MOLU|nr:DnaD family protein [Williamsoniiplasma somnilux]ATZ18837.1 hypothetical protein ESOMN_v1c04550 [Williamsoniiplasma somnilux]